MYIYIKGFVRFSTLFVNAAVYSGRITNKPNDRNKGQHYYFKLASTTRVLHTTRVPICSNSIQNFIMEIDFHITLFTVLYFICVYIYTYVYINTYTSYTYHDLLQWSGVYIHNTERFTGEYTLITIFIF